MSNLLLVAALVVAVADNIERSLTGLMVMVVTVLLLVLMAMVDGMNRRLREQLGSGEPPAPFDEARALLQTDVAQATLRLIAEDGTLPGDDLPEVESLTLRDGTEAHHGPQLILVGGHPVLHIELFERREDALAARAFASDWLVIDGPASWDSNPDAERVRLSVAIVREGLLARSRPLPPPLAEAFSLLLEHRVEKGDPAAILAALDEVEALVEGRAWTGHIECRRRSRCVPRPAKSGSALTGRA